MLEKILIYIKHNLKFIWSIIFYTNNLIIRILYRKKIYSLPTDYTSFCNSETFSYRILENNDSHKLYELFLSVSKDYSQYFKPHKTDKESLQKILKTDSFITLGVFDNEKMIGYFFLRLFANKRAFIGRLVSEKYQEKGIAKKMALILYQISDIIGFNVYSTISKNNIGSLKSHASVRKYTIIKELPNNYLLIKFDNNEIGI